MDLNGLNEVIKRWYIPAIEQQFDRDLVFSGRPQVEPKPAPPIIKLKDLLELNPELEIYIEESGGYEGLDMGMKPCIRAEVKGNCLYLYQQESTEYDEEGNYTYRNSR